MCNRYVLLSKDYHDSKKAMSMKLKGNSFGASNVILRNSLNTGYQNYNFNVIHSFLALRDIYGSKMVCMICLLLAYCLSKFNILIPIPNFENGFVFHNLKDFCFQRISS